MTIRTHWGEDVAVSLAQGLTVARLDKAGPADLKPGVFVGVGARPQPDGLRKAVQIVIFPESCAASARASRLGVMPEANHDQWRDRRYGGARSVDLTSPSPTRAAPKKVTTPADASVLMLAPLPTAMPSGRAAEAR